MIPLTKVTFRECAIDTNISHSVSEECGLILAIRTDAHHATRALKNNLLKHVVEQKGLSGLFSIGAQQSDQDGTFISEYIDRNISKAYQKWGHTVLSALAESVDYTKYGLVSDRDQHTHVHFYNSQVLAQQAIEKAEQYVNDSYGSEVPAILISLDDMITTGADNLEQIAFSRLFSICGNKHFGYVPRPGYERMDNQLESIRLKLEALSAQSPTGRTPIVLIEDNVRHAKMLNWLIDEMDKANLFDSGEIAAISTCFSCANDTEKSKIMFEGTSVPVLPVVDYANEVVDVSTTRDLMFDGLVVEIDDTVGRLPAIFMNLEKSFKLSSDQVDSFRKQVCQANVRFCKDLEESFGIDVPLSWFAVAEPVSHVSRENIETPMRKIITRSL